ncbi:hypothetical protein BGZ83_002836 [Gryganskiella cystojenkinii]|nr:hypothetical protein BGZ83_002836 [Gryganskiella cystojenkinii]
MVTAQQEFPDQDMPMDMDESQQPLEPEPEGPRMTRLRAVLEKSMSKTLETCNYAAIRECFPALSEAHPDDLRDAHDKVCLFLRVEINNEFEQILQERSVVHKLNALDQLIAESYAKGRTTGSRSILDLKPEVAVRARTVPTKEEEIERLKAELERVQLDNRRLGSALNNSKAEQAAIKLDVLESYNEFQEGAKIASKIPVQDMEKLLDSAMRHVQDL